MRNAVTTKALLAEFKHITHDTARAIVRLCSGTMNPESFGGGHRVYGRYQWCIKHYGWQSEAEIEAALSWAFGEHVKVGKRASDGNDMRGFDGLSDLLGRPIESSTAGRSGGWLIIETPLSDAELAKVDEHVVASMGYLDDFLREEREYHAAEVADENTHHAED